ncbi:MAG TPA: aldehyde dehydrogenase family protein, partial [Iamia sp.]
MAEPIVHDAFLIGGDWVAPQGTGTIDVINPSTEELFGRVPEGTTGDIDAAVAAARHAFDHGPWAAMSPKERGAVLAAASGAITGDMQGLAELIAGEMGCPVSWAFMGQVFTATMIADQYVGLADSYQFTDMRAGMMGPSEVRKVPYGVVAAIVPWNVPLFEAMIKLAPALVAGNTVVLKPAPETPLSAQAFGQILLDA